MSRKERQRYHLLKMVLEGNINLHDAGTLMAISFRHAKRLKRKLATEGARGSVHGNRGRSSLRALNGELFQRIIALSREKYVNFNDTHFTEKLNEVEGITVSRDTVRRLGRAHGIKPKRRPRKEQEGMMVLWDGSPHRWFGKDKPPCCLMAAFDVDTAKLLETFFVPYKYSFGYLKLLADIAKHDIRKKASCSSNRKPCSLASASPFLTAYSTAGLLIPRSLPISVLLSPNSLTAHWHHNPRVPA
jgi:transposase